MNIEEYGPYIWRAIHCAASRGYCSRFARFIHYLQRFFPCSVCRSHFVDNLRHLPVNSTACFAWSVDFHNLVNAQLRKPHYTFAQAHDDLRFCAADSQSTTELYFTTLFILLKYCEGEGGAKDLSCTSFMQVALDLLDLLHVQTIDANDIKTAFLSQSSKQSPFFTLLQLQTKSKCGVPPSVLSLIKRYYAPHDDILRVILY